MNTCRLLEFSKDSALDLFAGCGPVERLPFEKFDEEVPKHSCMHELISLVILKGIILSTEYPVVCFEVFRGLLSRERGWAKVDCRHGEKKAVAAGSGRAEARSLRYSYKRCPRQGEERGRSPTHPFPPPVIGPRDEDFKLVYLF